MLARIGISLLYLEAIPRAVKRYGPEFLGFALGVIFYVCAMIGIFFLILLWVGA